jgi:hypothetical protein
MKRITDNLNTILIVFLLIGSVIGANRYLATASELNTTNLRVENHIVGDQISQLQNRIWKIEDRYGIKPDGTCARPVPVSVMEELRQLREDLRLLDVKFKALQGGKG